MIYDSKVRKIKDVSNNNIYFCILDIVQRLNKLGLWGSQSSLKALQTDEIIQADRQRAVNQVECLCKGNLHRYSFCRYIGLFGMVGYFLDPFYFCRSKHATLQILQGVLCSTVYWGMPVYQCISYVRTKCNNIEEI